MPREAPEEISIAPFFSRARRCCSAALTERKPIRAAISARVGGYPDTSVSSRTRRRTSVCRAVSSSILGLLTLEVYPVWAGESNALDQARALVRGVAYRFADRVSAHESGRVGADEL